MYIPLEKAYVCVSCECIGNNPYSCDHCGADNNIIHLERWLKRVDTLQPQMGLDDYTGCSIQIRARAAQCGSFETQRKAAALRSLQ